MKVMAIVQRYYRDRREYLWPILRSLDAQTLRPERVILWNNFRERGEVIHFPGLEVHEVHSSVNTLMGRYAAIVLADSEYVYIQDDDLIMGSDVVGKLCAASAKFGGALVGPFGSKLAHSDKPYREGRRVQEGRCDVVLGRCFAASRASLLMRLARADLKSFGRCDDIVMSMAGEAYAVPNCAFTNLDERGVGLSYEPQHFDERDAMARRLLVS